MPAHHSEGESMTITAPLDLQPHSEPCRSEEEHVGRHYAETFPRGVADLPGQPYLIPTLLDFAAACTRTWAEECEAAGLDLDEVTA